MDWLGWGMEDMPRWGQFCLLTNSGWEFQAGDTVSAKVRRQEGREHGWRSARRKVGLESRAFLSRPHLFPLLLPPLQSDSYQEDIYPMTPGTEPALTPDEWLGGINRGEYC